MIFFMAQLPETTPLWLLLGVTLTYLRSSWALVPGFFCGMDSKQGKDRVECFSVQMDKLMKDIQALQGKTDKLIITYYGKIKKSIRCKTCSPVLRTGRLSFERYPVHHS